MSHQFNDKDYGEYFSAIERSLQADSNKKTEKKTESIIEETPEKPPKKGLFGAVIDLRRHRRWIVCAAVFICVAALVAVSISAVRAPRATDKTTDKKENTVVDAEKNEKANLWAKRDGNTQSIADDIISENVIFIDLENNTVIAERNSQVRCYPASTTKIMTLLVAVENIENFNDTFTMTFEITDPLFVAGASVAGFLSGEVISMTDLLYGTILPSGADACVALAQKISGSEEAFVGLMNQKAKALGLRDTHFENTSGLHHENHYTTAEDMAVILRAAMENELCRKVLSTYQHTTAVTPQHPEGILLTSTLFSHIYGTEPEGADIIGGKTGFVNESGYCIAAFGKSDAGDEFICVTLKGSGLWPTVYDQINLFSQYANSGTAEN